MTYVYEKLSAADIARKLLADEYAGWNYEQAAALADYLIEYAETKGQPLELDRVAVRCDFAAYASAIEAAKDYGQEPEDEAAALKYFDDNAFDYMHLQCDDGSVLVRNF